MHRMKGHVYRIVMNRRMLSVILACALPCVQAANTAIGLAVAQGGFQIDQSRVWGNATVFDGTTIETGQAASQVRLTAGGRVRLASDSRARIYQDHALLEKGTGQVEASNSYALEAQTLRISGADSNSVARVELQGSGRVLVAALAGGVHVKNAQGMLVGNVQTGGALSFDVQAAGAAAPVKISGCLLSRQTDFLLVDQTSNLIFQVNGPELAKEAGNRVEITGAAEAAKPTVNGASQLIKVLAMKRVAAGGCASSVKTAAAAGIGGASAGAGGAAGAAGAAAGAGGHGGAISLTTIAIIGGVAVAGATAGLAASGALSGSSDSVPTTSR